MIGHNNKDGWGFCYKKNIIKMFQKHKDQKKYKSTLFLHPNTNWPFNVAYYKYKKYSIAKQLFVKGVNPKLQPVDWQVQN